MAKTKRVYSVSLDIKAVEDFKTKFKNSSMSSVLSDALIAYNNLSDVSAIDTNSK